MGNEQDRVRPRGRTRLGRDAGEATEFENLVGRAPRFQGLAKVAAGEEGAAEEERLTPSQRKFLDEFTVGLAKGVEESGDPADG